MQAEKRGPAATWQRAAGQIETDDSNLARDRESCDAAPVLRSDGAA